MTDQSSIQNKLEELDRYIGQLRQLQRYTYDDLITDLEKCWAVEHGLQLVAQIVIDVGNALLADVGENQIETYADVIDQLGQRKILPPDFAQSIRGMAGFRNVLVHHYSGVNLHIVHDVLQNRLEDFADFIRYIQDYLTRKG
jgi:uncharacterized protein YutE (UPF0331/DUF86 family)